MIAHAGERHRDAERELELELEREPEQDAPPPPPPPTTTTTTQEFGRLLEGALPKLKRFVRFHAGGVVRARECDSDIAQSVCREALVDRDRFRYGGARGMNRWLFTRAKRKIRDRVRYYTADKRDLAREGPLRVAGDRASATRSLAGVQLADSRTPERIVLERERDAHLREAIAALPEDYRSVVILARLEGLSHEEIGRRLGRSRVATRKLLHRAMARLARAE